MTVQEIRFDVHERGIAHLANRSHRSWTWDQVRWVRGRPAQGAGGRLRRFTGWDFTCRADFTDGASIQFNRLTTGSDSIAETIYACCPNVAPDDEIHRWHIGRWVLPFLASGFGWAVLAGFLWFNEDYTLDDSTLMLAATGFLCCFIGFITSITYLLTRFGSQLRRRDRHAHQMAKGFGNRESMSVLAERPAPPPDEYARILVGHVLLGARYGGLR